MAVVRSSEVDQNNDGLLDRLEIGVQLPLKSTESITGIQALFTHNCILKDKAKYSPVRSKSGAEWAKKN